MQRVVDIVSTINGAVSIPDWQEVINYTKNNNLKSNENSWHMCHEEFPCYAGCIKKVR